MEELKEAILVVGGLLLFLCLMALLLAGIFYWLIYLTTQPTWYNILGTVFVILVAFYYTLLVESRMKSK
ncbi:MAG: hypothetical protein OEX12_05790 [Gammaproteobacteria bacterium]|nr:hypothetical protein [Gammaproteobacteria bacterium]